MRGRRAGGADKEKASEEMRRTGRKLGRVKGQWIILTALALVVAVAVIYMAYVSSEVLPAASIQRPAYGLMSQDWPKLVQLLAGYTRFVAQSGLSGLTTAAMASGLYNNLLSPQSIYLQLTAAGSYVNNSLAAAESSLLSVGAFISSSYRLNQSGFAGSLGPYPAAVVLSNVYNFSKLYGRYIQFSSDYVYRFVVTTYVPVPSDYVVIYSGDVRRPAAPGEGYNSVVNTILNLARQGDSFDAALLKGKLYLILVNNSALAEALKYYAGLDGAPSDREGCSWSPAVQDEFQRRLAKAFVVLPWWAEYVKCPFCLFDFKMPRGSLATPGSVEIAVLIYAEPTSSVDIYLHIPDLLNAFDIQPRIPNQCFEPWNQPYKYTIQQADSGNNNPYAVYDMNGQEWFFNAHDLFDWQSSVTIAKDKECRGTNFLRRSIRQIIPINVHGNQTNGLLLGAEYPAGAYNVGFNIWWQFSIPNDWPGFQVRTLVNVTEPGAEKMGFLSLYFGGYDGSTFPLCADMVAVQPTFSPPAFAWSFLPQGYGSGPWASYAWQQGGSYVPLGNDWYVLSISQILQGPTAGRMYLSVYKFVDNRSGPMSLYAGQWLAYSPLTDFSVVLGVNTEDFPGSSPWTAAAVYAFLAVRPWTYPEPSAVLTAVGAAPVANTPRPTIIAWGPASAVSARVSTLGNISLALVTGLNITIDLSVAARVKSAYIRQYNTTFIRYSYGILLNSSLPKSSLGAQFSLFYNYGGGVYNYTCGTGLCNASLASYYGYTAGVDSALWNVTFLVPRHSNFAVVAKVLGASIAVNNYSVVHPLVYYLWDWNRNSLYLINVGNSDAVFYFPWRDNKPVVLSVSPNDGVFGARADINVSGIGSWTLVIVPPASAVNVTFSSQYAAQIQEGFPTQFTPAWEQPYMYVRRADPPSSGCAYLPTYFPSQFLEDHYTLLIPSLILRAIGKQPSSGLSFYVFMKGSWTQVQYALDNLNDIWLRINAYPGWFSYRGTLIAVCGGGSSSPRVLSSTLPSLFDYYSAALPSPGALAQYANLLSHPFGYAVIVNVTGVSNLQDIQAVYLYNKSAPPSQCSEGVYSGKILEFYRAGIWRNQFAGVCRGQNVWAYYGTGRESFFIFAVTRDSAYFYIATASSSDLNPFNDGGTVYWWFNGWANTRYDERLLINKDHNGPLYSFDSVNCTLVGAEVCEPGMKIGVMVKPFMWPQPYFVINGQIYQTI